MVLSLLVVFWAAALIAAPFCTAERSCREILDVGGNAKSPAGDRLLPVGLISHVATSKAVPLKML